MGDDGRELMHLLKDIYDDHDFVCGTMSVAGSEEAWVKMRDYILYAKGTGHPVSSEDMIALSSALREEVAVDVVGGGHHVYDAV